MRPNSFITCLFSILIMVGGPTLALAETTSTTTVEFPAVIHFLTPAGDDIEVGPGIYEVEAAESWLKLVPEGQGRTEAVLVEATSGTHEETLPEPAVRLKGMRDNPDVFHLGLLLADGTGLEAIGTTSGIRPRGLNLAFMQRATPRKRTFTQQPRVSQKSSPTIALQPGLTLPKLEGKVVTPPPRSPSAQLSCALSHEIIPGSTLRDFGDVKFNWPSQVHVAVFQNQLHVVSGITKKCEGLFPGAPKFCGVPPEAPGVFDHFIFDGGGWTQLKSEHQLRGLDSGTSIALAVYGNNLWGVWKDKDKQLWYSRYYDQWSPKQPIPGQKSKSTPALAVKSGRLHMLHQGKNSDDLWYSVFAPGSGWSKNVKIGQKSEGTPGLAWFNDGFLHVMYQRAGVPNGSLFGEQRFTTLFHSYLGRDGKSWLPPYKIAQAESQDSPTMITGANDKRGGGLMVHRGKSTNTLWSTLYGKPNPNRSGSVRWYDDHRLPGPTSDGPVGLAWYQGCLHMVHKEGKKLIHTTLSLKDAHPEALK